MSKYVDPNIGNDDPTPTQHCADFSDTPTGYQDYSSPGYPTPTYQAGYPAAAPPIYPQHVHLLVPGPDGKPIQPIPPNYWLLSTIVYFCLGNCLFGGIALALSSASSKAADEKDYETAKKLGRQALYVDIAGIAITVIFVVSVILVMVFNID